MFRTSWAIALTLVLFGAADAHAQFGRLQNLRNDAGGSLFGSNSSSIANNGIDLGDDSDGNLTLGTIAVVSTLVTLYVLPIFLVNDKYDETLAFAPHPYACDYCAYQLRTTGLTPDAVVQDNSEVPRKSWAVRLSIENGNDFEGLNRVGGQLRIENESRFGIVSNWNYFHESISGGKSDETLIGDTNLIFRFAQSEMISFYSGLGFRVLADRKQSDYGFNYTYGSDWFLVQPMVVSTCIDAGTLGGAWVFHTRATVGALYHGCEFFGGYDFLRIGNTNLQGPMAGIRFWF